MSEKKPELVPVNTRYLCDIIEDLRKTYETRNFSYLPGIIEELQYRANRMENYIEIGRELTRMEDRRRTLKEEVKKLEKELGKKNRW